MLETYVRALSAWKNALVEAQNGRKGTTPKYRESEAKQRKVACQSGHVLAQRTKHAPLPSRLQWQCEKCDAQERAAFSGAQRLPRAQRQVKLEVQIAPAACKLLVTGFPAPDSLVWWSTRGDRAPDATRRCRCWRGCSSAKQHFRRGNAMY